jgi:putative acetyltransferase
MSTKLHLNITLRPAEPGDAAAVADVATQAFGRPDEARIIAELEKDGDVWLHVVAVMDGKVIGQALFYHLGVFEKLSALGLGPMSVDPWVQRQRIGMSMVRYGLDACERAGAPIVFVLGHKDYYPKMGFSAEATNGFESPWSGHPEFMALRLRHGPPMSGRLVFPKAFGVS